MKRQDYVSWDAYFMGVAMLSAERSKDNNTQVGACTAELDADTLPAAAGIHSSTANSEASNILEKFLFFIKNTVLFVCPRYPVPLFTGLDGEIERRFPGKLSKTSHAKL